MSDPLLTLRDLAVDLPMAEPPGRVRLLDGVDLRLDRGERLGLVGESGSGKSLTALAVMGLLPERMQATGQLRLAGQDLLSLPETGICRLRGRRMAMIFQEPMTALNPVKTIGDQIAEGRRLHLGESRRDALAKARALLDRVGLPAPRFGLDRYPHQLSGGQRQRVMIAMAIACEPELLIADEPTTALDVTVQAQILALLDELIEASGTALLLITHDLGVVSTMTDRVAVMYSGRVVDTGTTADVLTHLAHPYTRGLVAASPHVAARAAMETGRAIAKAGVAAPRPRLAAIPGVVPEPAARPPGCAFAARCSRVEDDCRHERPPLAALPGNDRFLSTAVPMPPAATMPPVAPDEHAVACLHPWPFGKAAA